MMPWGTIGMVVIAGLMLAGTYAKGRLDGARGPNATIVAMKAQYAAEEAARVAQIKQREKEDETAKRALAEQLVVAESERAAANVRTERVRRDLAAVLVNLRSVRDACPLPAVSRSVGDDAAGGNSSSPAPVPATEAPAAAPGQVVAATNCLDVYATGVENTLAAKFNADEVNRCWRYAIPLWEACTAQHFPYPTAAPWLIPGEPNASTAPN